MQLFHKVFGGTGKNIEPGQVSLSVAVLSRYALFAFKFFPQIS